MSILKTIKLSSVRCIMGCHEFETIREVSNEVKEVKCRNCGKEFGIYDGISSCLPLDDEMRAIHSSLIFSKITFSELKI